MLPFFLFLSLLVCNITSLFAAKVGLLIMATGRYDIFVDPLISTARNFFCPDHEVTYFVFTDGKIEEAADVVKVHQSRLGWPYDTMMRYHTYAKSENLYAEQDYLYACDADMLFLDTFGDEILGERVATLHPGFLGRRGSYETNPLSLACVHENEGTYYFAGGFYGGKTQEFMQICKLLAERVDEDLSQNIIAIWHDESHWNRYCVDNNPTVILTPSYCYPETLIHHPEVSYYPASIREPSYPKKLIALDKHHKDLRKE